MLDEHSTHLVRLTIVNEGKPLSVGLQLVYKNLAKRRKGEFDVVVPQQDGEARARC